MTFEGPHLDLWNDYNQSITFIELINYIQVNSIKKIYIGSDSKPHRCFINYATAVCFINNGSCYYFYNTRREKNNFIDASSTGLLLHRLSYETNLSVAAANKIHRICPNLIVSIHSDINSDSRYKSNIFNNSAKSIINGHGYEYVCKPNSWAASTVADWYTK